MNNRWRKIAFLKYRIKLDENYKYIESAINPKNIKPVRFKCNTQFKKSKSFRKGAKHYGR